MAVSNIMTHQPRVDIFPEYVMLKISIKIFQCEKLLNLNTQNIMELEQNKVLVFLKLFFVKYSVNFSKGHGHFSLAIPPHTHTLKRFGLFYF